MDKLVSSKSSENLRMAKKLSNNSRYIDDIGVCNMNNNNDFMICSKDISPESIPLTAGCIENDKRYFFGFGNYSPPIHFNCLFEQGAGGLEGLIGLPD